MQDRKAIKTFSLGSKSQKKWKVRTLLMIFSPLLIGIMYWFGAVHYALSWTGSNFSSILGAVGFSLKEVVIEGHERLKSTDILKNLGIFQKDPLFSVSLEKIQEQALKNPWIRSVVVQRQLPDTLYLRIVERRPLALWKDEKGNTIMVDDEGELIRSKPPLEYETLPMVLGEDAYKRAPKIIKELQSFPEISSRMTGLVWIGARRWDLILNKKTHVQLPESALDVALKKLETLQIKHKIFEKKILKIDLRVENKIILKPSPDASLSIRGGKVVGKKT